MRRGIRGARSKSFVAIVAALALGAGARAQEIVPTDLPTNRSSVNVLQPGSGTAAALGCGVAKTRTLNTPGKVHRFELKGVAGGVVDLVLLEVAGFAGSVPQARLTDKAGATLATFAGTALETFQAPQTGRYRLEVSSTGTGTYRLAVGCRPPAGRSQPLPPGQVVTGSLEEPGELDYFTFSGTGGITADLSLIATSGFGASVPRVTVYAPNGSALGTFDADALRSFPLVTSGTYVVRVRSNTLLGTGGYALGLSFNPPLMPTPLTCGTVVEKSIPWAGTVEWFTFDGAVDDPVELSLVVASGFTAGRPQLELFAPSGLSQGVFSGTSLTPFVLPEDGSYVVRVTSSNASSTGNFSIGLSCRPPVFPAPVTIACGGAVSGSIGVVGEVDYFDFSANVGETAELTLTTTAGFPSSEPQMEIFSPSGVDLGAFNADTGSPHPIAIQETGTYAVRVIGNTLQETGGYSLSLSCLPPPFTAVFLGANSLNPAQITAPGEVDPYAFDGEMGEVVELTLVQTSGFGGTNARATLYSPLGTNLGSFLANSLNEFTLPSTGRYTVDVDAANGAGVGDYNVSIDRRFPVEPLPPPLACGQVYSSTIAQPGEADYYTFDGMAGDTVELTIAQTAGWSGTNAYIYVYSPTDVFLGSKKANGLLQLVLPESGTYRIRINAGNLIGTGSYNVGHFCLFPTAPVQSHLVPGDLVSSSIGRAAELDLYTFDGAAGDTFELTLVQTGGWAGTNAYASVWSPSRALLGTVQANASLEQSLSETGEYVVRVWAGNLAATGLYNLGLWRRHATPAPLTSHLTAGDQLSETIGAPGEFDYFTFDATAGDTFELTLVQTNGWAGTNAYMALWSPSNTLVGTSQKANRAFSPTLGETGRYVVRVWAGDLLGTGTYQLSLWQRFPSAAPVTSHMSAGDQLTGTIGLPGEFDYFTFDATAGDTFELTLVQTNGWAGTNAYMALWSPSNTLVGTSQKANRAFSPTLGETGRYVVRVWAGDLLGTGTYQLSLWQRFPSAAPVTSHMSAGDQLTGTIGLPGEFDYFTFDATAGDAVELTLVQTAGWAGTNAYLQVWSPSNAPVGSSLKANGGVFPVLGETGRYVVRIWAGNLVGTGTYQVSLWQRYPNPAPLTSHLTAGDRFSGTIGQPGEFDYFTFDATANDAVELTLVQTSGWAGTNAYLKVWSPSGQPVGTSLKANGAFSPILGVTGTYVVRVWAGNLLASGTYDLSLWRRAPAPAPLTSHLEAGDHFSGTISAPGEFDYFTFDGSAGEVVDLTLVQTAGWAGTNAYFKVWSPSGAVVLNAISANRNAPLALSETGVHVIRVWAGSLVATGSFNLGFWRRLPTPTPTVAHLSCGDLLSSTIDLAGEFEYFTFDGTAGEVVDLTLTQTSGWAGTNAYFKVWSPTNAVVLGNTRANALATVALTENGTHVVRVWAGNLLGTGSYNLGFSCR